MKKLTKFIVLLLLSIIILISISFFLREFISNYFVRLNLDAIDAPDSNSKVLVFAPHCDDEVLGAGELIKKTIKAGGEVRVVLITNGDGFKDALEFDYLNLHPKSSDYVNFGYTRQTETINALKILGLNEKNITFLGYPDGGISYLWNSNWYNSEPFTSTYTQANSSPYSNSYTKAAVYSGESIVKDITTIIQDFKPTHLVFPHPNDRHPDHWATNTFVKYALASMNYSPKEELLYLVHRGDWPTPMKEDTDMYLVPPAKLINTGTKWYTLPLNNEDIVEKISAIHAYKTQLKTLGLLLSAFERKNELLGKYDDLEIPSFKKQDSDITPSQANKIIDDPTQDAIKLNLSSEADISGVYIENSQNKNLHLFIETRGNVEKETQYNINLFVFTSEEISRLNLEIKDNKLTIRSGSKKSITDIKGIQTLYSGKFLHITIPNDGLGSYKQLFLNASTSLEDHMMDKTAWRMVINK